MKYTHCINCGIRLMRVNAKRCRSCAEIAQREQMKAWRERNPTWKFDNGYNKSYKGMNNESMP
jgi:predicted amidohydrolase YtcJ